MILGDVVSDEVDPTDVVSLAFKELYVQCDRIVVVFPGALTHDKLLLCNKIHGDPGKFFM